MLHRENVRIPTQHIVSNAAGEKLVLHQIISGVWFLTPGYALVCVHHAKTITKIVK